MKKAFGILFGTVIGAICGWFAGALYMTCGIGYTMQGDRRDEVLYELDDLGRNLKRQKAKLDTL